MGHTAVSAMPLASMQYENMTKIATKIDTIAITNKMKLRSFKSSKHINEKGDVPYCGFG